VLALMAPNGPEYAVVFHGAAMAVRACAGTAVTEVYLLGEAGQADGTMPVRPLRALAGAPLAAHVPGRPRRRRGPALLMAVLPFFHIYHG
jgi:hypothetical protein